MASVAFVARATMRVGKMKVGNPKEGGWQAKSPENHHQATLGVFKSSRIAECFIHCKNLSYIVVN